MAEITTVEIIGPEGDFVINESDLDLWQSKGYRLKIEVPASENQSVAVGTTELENATTPQLKAAAERVGIASFQTMRRAVLIASLRERFVDKV